MIDVNKITSTLAKLPDAQLQQYAQMHKADPYIMALAMSESNRRKEMRAAGQGAQGMQEQPKVVDQMVAEMAPRPAQPMPEDQGIGQLPAGNMNFAGGGIIAFADGGDVERYSGQFGSLTGDIPGFVAGTGNFIPQAGAPEEVPLLRRLFRDARATGANYQVEQAKARIAAGVGTSADQAILAAAQPAQSTAPSSQDMAQFDAASNLYMTERANKQAAAAAPKVDATPKAAPARKTPAAATAKAETGFDSLLKSLDAGTAPASTDSGFSSKIKDLTASRVKSREEEATGLEAIQKQFSDIYKGREDRLSQREGELGKMKDQSFGLALLQAGAAMMSTPGNLGTAIGKGVDVGSRQYIAGMDKLNAAKEKLSDARDRLDDLNAQRGEMSARERLKAQSAIKSEESAGLELLLKADMDMHKISREEALKRLDLRTRVGIAQLQEQGQNVRSANQVAAANRPSAEIQSVERIMKEQNIPFSAALSQYRTTLREPVSEEKLRAEWLDPAKNMMILQQYPNIKTFDDYKTVMGMGGGAGDFKVVGVRPAK